MTALATTTEDAPRQLALLKAVGLDRVSPEQRELTLAIAKRYDLDLLLKHVVLIDGRPYLTRDGLLHIAHRSGHLDGITTTEPVIVEGFWRAICTVYRKDMSHPFVYTGRYPTTGGNAKFAPEMAVKVAEVMALRRAFDVAAPTAEERWDQEIPIVEPVPKPTLAERAAEKRAEIETPAEPVEESAPAGLTKRQFVDALAAADIAPEYAMSVREIMFPKGEFPEIDASQRAELLAELTKPVPA